MFIPKKTKEVYKFNLDDRSERQSYQDLLDDPCCRIIDKKYVTHTETQFEKDFSSTETTNHIYIEVERCGL